MIQNDLRVAPPVSRYNEIKQAALDGCVNGVCFGTTVLLMTPHHTVNTFSAQVQKEGKHIPFYLWMPVFIVTSGAVGGVVEVVKKLTTPEDVSEGV